MEQEMICKNCTHYAEKAIPNRNKGQCRRYPPVSTQKSEYSNWGWPIVNEDDFCGEFGELIK
jgi:hypothetical protein